MTKEELSTLIIITLFKLSDHLPINFISTSVQWKSKPKKIERKIMKKVQLPFMSNKMKEAAKW